MDKKSIILIGMPAAGKSTVGVILAKLIGYDFVDTDLLIQKSEGKRLEEIIRERGVDGFIKVEEAVCCGYVPEIPTVIATGGSVVYGAKAMQHFREMGTLVYLDLGFEELQKRLHNIQQRGVVLREGQTLRDLYDERTILYNKYADIVIEEKDKGIEETVREIVGKMVHE